MGVSNRIILSVMVAMTVACQQSGGNGGGSGEEEEEAVVAGAAINGDYEGIDTFLTNIRVVSLGSGTPPVEADCEGDIDIVIDDGAVDEIVGSGQCLTPANVAEYELAGAFVNDEDFEGVITIRFSSVDHVLDFEGSLVGDELSATFAGRTPQVGNIVIDWDGEFSAQRI